MMYNFQINAVLESIQLFQLIEFIAIKRNI